MNKGKWIGEVNERIGAIIQFRLKKIIYEDKSKYYHIVVADTEPLGRMLLFKEGKDYTIQSAQYYDFYDEMLAHVPMASHPNPRRVLIIGGGDGIVLREILKYETIEEVVLVEIEPAVVEISKKYLQLDWGALSDPRVSIIYGDAARYVMNIDREFDVIIGDYSDPYQDLPAGSLVQERFYQNANKLLSSNGILAVQSGSPIFQKDIMLRIYKNASKFFELVKIYWAPVIYYPGGIWSFVVATKGIDPSVPRRIMHNAAYYSPEIHKMAFILPPFIRDLVEKDETERIDG